MGEQVARITSVRSVRGGVLYVDVESPVWAQEMQYYKPDLLAKINKHIGSDAIRDIHFSVRAIKRTIKQKPVARRAGRNQTPDIQLTLDECREIEEAASHVCDEELRGALKSTMSSYRRLERWMEIQGWRRCPACKALHNRERGCPFCLLGPKL